MKRIEAGFSRGICPIMVFEPDGAAAMTPVVILFMDAFGPRPALFSIAQRLAGEGYRVLLPHLFYHMLPFTPFDPLTTFSDPAERERLMGYFGSIDQPAVDADVTATLDLVANRYTKETPVACVGYCMGGRYALTAAVTDMRVAFAGAFHGSRLAPDALDSPHHRLGHTAARIYVGIADNDPTFGGEEEGRLAAAMGSAGTDHVIETYKGAAHGFVMEDLPVHDAQAAARHWRHLAENLAETLSTGG